MGLFVMWLAIVLFSIGTAVFFVGANWILWLVFRSWPSLLLSENERLSVDYFARFEGELKPYIPEWFNIDAEEWPEFVEELKRIMRIGGHVYDPFVELKHPQFSGRFYHFHEAAFRHVRLQGPWPPSPEFFNIFFFGGSTTMNVGPDWTAIPSYLQDQLNDTLKGDKIRVYNFGCGSYFSTQERIRLQQVLLDRAVPNLVIFLDGVNDFYFFDGRPSIAGFFQHALDTHNRENLEATKNRTGASPKWQKLKEFWWSLPLLRATDLIADVLAKRKASAAEVPYRPIEVDPDTLVPALNRYLDNKRQIEAICGEYGIDTLFVLQPTPAYKYDLRHHVALSHHYGLGGHERSGVGYGLIAKALETQLFGANFLSLADIQENEQRPLYLDNMHYTSEFSRIIAQHIATAVITRAILGQPTASHGTAE